MSAPRSISSTRPFHSCAQEYVDKGWGILPLPRKRKEFPPKGFTGRAGRFADADDLARWLADPQYDEGNIALRVGNMLTINGVRYEVIGIDVDAHSGKKGAKELQGLLKRLGPLPDTWTSSSRDDGVSGIRFYLVPYGYGFKGKASDSIDIVQRVHRYAVCYPSWHPDTKTQYFWYAPGNPCDGKSFTLEIPNANELPILPDPWVDELTAGRTKDDEGQYGIDLDSTWEDITAWRKKHFNPDWPDSPGGMCPEMRAALERQIKKIEASPTAHEKITNAHWNLICVATEGHSGLKAAIEEIEAVWLKLAVGVRGRSLSQAKAEKTRSLKNAFRKIKAKAESFAEQGFSLFSKELCRMDFKLPPISVEGAPYWIKNIPLSKEKNDGKPIDPRDYDKNDRGMADLFFDRVGDNFHYLSDYNGWIIYDGKTWHIDDFNHIRDLFHRACVKPCKKAGLRAQVELMKHLASGGTKDDAIGAPLKAAAVRLLWIAEHYGNDSRVKGMLNQLKSIPGVGMRYSELNWDTSVLAMPGGKVLKLDEPSNKPNPNALAFKVVENSKEFFTTMSTSAEYVEPDDLENYEKRLWIGYLKLFLPDVEYRRFVQKALGYILIGGNPEKLAIFMVGIRNTGKSTMIQALQAALGDYGATFQPNSVFKDSGTGTNPELGNLLHKRGIFSSESGSQRIYANPLKRNTGGDKISVTRKYANDQIIGIPHFVPVVATNQAPTIDDADEALVKRIMVLPFDIQVSDVVNDRRADVVIPRDAKRAVFTWLVQGYRLYVREGLSYEIWPDVVKARTLEFAAELSDVSTFLSEVCEVASDEEKHRLSADVISKEHDAFRASWMRVSCSTLYSTYRQEMDEASQKPLSQRAFSKKVRNMFGVEVTQRWVDGRNVKSYVGLKWKNEEAMLQKS